MGQLWYQMRRRMLPCTVAALSLLSTAGYAQFGSSKPSFGNIFNNKNIEIVRKLPPVYDLHGKRISVVIGADAQAGRTNVEIQSEIEKILTGFDSTVHVETVNPDIAIVCQISNYSAPVVVQTQVEDVLIKTGSGVHTVSTIQGGINIAFRIEEVRTGHIIAASVASAEISQRLSGSSSLGGFSGTKKPKDPDKIETPFDAQNVMVREAARQIASYLAITPESVQIQLAVGGPLTEPNKLAQNLLWSRYLETLDSLQPLPDPMLDSYRLYDLGVANEALAYQAKDLAASQKYLHEASIDYGKAVEANPKEKYFLPPQTRITSALEHYAANKTVIAEAKVENKGAAFIASGPGAPSSGGTLGGGSAARSAPKGAGLSNDDVIRMVKAGVDEEGVTDAIKTAPSVNFDMTPDGLINLTTNGVSSKIQSVMRLRARAPTTRKKG